MSGKSGKKYAVPESTGTCTSRYTDFRVLPANNMSASGLISLSPAHLAAMRVLSGLGYTEEDLLSGEKTTQHGLDAFLKKKDGKSHRK